jgi:Ribosomally synthesized peptide prototyped by Frankia Franean1_4349.
VAQRSIEVVVGRLLTDEEFREAFLGDPHRALGELQERGLQLTAVEIRALTAIDATLWEQVADRIDPRLQKASLKGS